MTPDLNNRKQKAIDIASTYVQVLITLSTAIFAAIIGFYPTLLTIDTFNFDFLHYSLFVFMISIFCGLCGLGGLVSSTNKDTEIEPTSTLQTRIPTLC
jgi:hypothetical protein